MKFVVPRMVFSLVLICAGFNISLAQSTCSAPDLVCAAKTSVYRVVGPAGDASAVRIGSELLITNRQVIGGQTKISVQNHERTSCYRDRASFGTLGGSNFGPRNTS